MLSVQSATLDIERHVTHCPFCDREVEFLCIQNGGVLRSPNYILVADWIFHTSCWDKQVQEYEDAINSVSKP